MRKNEIITYLKSKLDYDVDYLTESWFIDKEHRRLVFFSCSGGSKVLSRDVVDVVIGNGKK